MKVFKLLHKIFKKSSSKFHSNRITALFNACSSLLRGKRLTLTGLARSINGKCKPKSAIRKIDILLSNPRLHDERIEYYQCIARQILSGIIRPIISIDWTAAPSHEFYCLRASINIKGRSFVLYEEVHPRKYEKNTLTNHDFLDNLKTIFPNDSCPIIVTDAGFRTPWCKKVRALGWDFITRVRNDNLYYDSSPGEWAHTYSLYKLATNKANFIGSVLLTKSTKLLCNLYLYKGNMQGRKRFTKAMKVSRRSASLVQSKAHKDPLLLATSLDNQIYTPSQIVNLYQKRMEIEEEFRDLKSHRYGFSMKYSGTKSVARLQVLLLIAMITNFICWIISLTLRRKQQHLDYQANTIKHFNVLSVQFLACEAFKRMGKKLTLLSRDIKLAISDIKSYAKEALYA